MQAGKSISVRPFQAEPPQEGRAGGPRRPRRRPPRRPARTRAVAQQAPDRTLYVGNLPYDATAGRGADARQHGVAADSVVRVHLPMDADGRKRGFGFVTMASAEAAKTAADALRQADLRGRRLVVNLAHPKGERPERAPGGGRRRRRRRQLLGPLPTVVQRRARGPSGPTHRKPAATRSAESARSRTAAARATRASAASAKSAEARTAASTTAATTTTSSALPALPLTKPAR